MKKYLIAGVVIGVVVLAVWYFSQEATPNLPMPTPPPSSQAE